MSAQKELAELLKYDLACNTFIRDHGPAIAELIEAARTYKHECSHGSHRQDEIAARERLFLIIAAITEPK